MRYLIIDTETTGLRVNDGDRIYDISCVEVIDSKITRHYQAYCNPMREISLETKEIAFVPDHLDKEPDFKSIFQGFIDLVSKDANGIEDDPILVIHNAKFDLGFIQNECKIYNIDFDINSFKCIDTVKMARLKFPDKKVNLDSLASIFKVNVSDKREKHRALDDCKILANVFIEMTKESNPLDYIQKDNYEVNFGIKKREAALEPRNIYTNS